MKYSIKEQVQDSAHRVERIALNIETLLQPTALIVVCAFSGWAVRRVHIDVTVQWVVTISLAIIVVRAAHRYIKFFDR